jgi:hypothetical protein
LTHGDLAGILVDDGGTDAALEADLEAGRGVGMAEDEARPFTFDADAFTAASEAERAALNHGDRTGHGTKIGTGAGTGEEPAAEDNQREGGDGDAGAPANGGSGRGDRRGRKERADLEAEADVGEHLLLEGGPGGGTGERKGGHGLLDARTVLPVKGEAVAAIAAKQAVGLCAEAGRERKFTTSGESELRVREMFHRDSWRRA